MQVAATHEGLELVTVAPAVFYEPSLKWLVYVPNEVNYVLQSSQSLLIVACRAKHFKFSINRSVQAFANWAVALQLILAVSTRKIHEATSCSGRISELACPSGDTGQGGAWFPGQYAMDFFARSRGKLDFCLRCHDLVSIASPSQCLIALNSLGS